MHTLLALSSLLLIIFGSQLALNMLQSVRDWSQRRIVQLFVLTMPMIVLGLGMSELHEFIVRLCTLKQPSWDALLGVALPFVMGTVALSAVTLGAIRLLLMGRVVTRHRVLVSPELQMAVYLRGLLTADVPTPRMSKRWLCA